MASRTTCHHRRALNFVLRLESQAFSQLVVAGRRPFHLKNFLAWPNELLRLAVAFQTPLHLERGDLPRERHLIYTPVTGRAADAFFDMNAVIEISEIGEVVNARPLNWFAGAPAFADWCKVGAVSEKLRVTIHASLGRRQSSYGAGFDCRMTITTINPVIAYMMLVAKLHRLRARDISLRDIRRPIDTSQHPQRRRENKKRAENTHLGQRVGAAVKDLGHTCGLCLALL